MILGMSVATYTLVHVLISLFGIATGLVLLIGWIGGRHLGGWAAAFLTSTFIANLSGYAFPFAGLTPAQIIGAISLVVLAFAMMGLYGYHLSGAWRNTYVIGSTVALYFNVFILVVQSFRKIPALHMSAPTESEPPFVAAQTAVLLVFTFLGFLATRKFRHAQPGMA